MPALGVLILIAQIACAVHVIRSGRPYFWIYLVVFVPLVGMAVYFIVEVMPGLANSRTAQQAASGMARTLDPGRGLREAMRRAEITPTAASKTALAQEFVNAGQIDAAISLYREALTGIHATDPVTMLGLARALFAKGDFAECRRVLEDLREANPDYGSSEGHLIYARCLELLGDKPAALREYAALVPYYPGQEARYRYALLLRDSGETGEARRLLEEICKAIDYGPRHQYREQRQWYQLAKQELAG